MGLSVPWMTKFQFQSCDQSSDNTLHCQGLRGSLAIDLLNLTKLSPRWPIYESTLLRKHAAHLGFRVSISNCLLFKIYFTYCTVKMVLYIEGRFPTIACICVLSLKMSFWRSFCLRLELVNWYTFQFPFICHKVIVWKAKANKINRI